VEPYLLQIGLVARTRQGRVATGAAYEHLGATAPDKSNYQEEKPGEEESMLF